MSLSSQSDAKHAGDPQVWLPAQANINAQFHPFAHRPSDPAADGECSFG